MQHLVRAAGAALAMTSAGLAQAQAPATRPAIVDVKSCAPTADDYPFESRRLEETGTTHVQFTVDPQGRLLAFGVSRTSGHLRLDLAALVRLVTCRFVPARDAQGQPVTASFAVSYVWRLE